jgi:thiol-disulfide isomerase/thioredoxin
MKKRYLYAITSQIILALLVTFVALAAGQKAATRDADQGSVVEPSGQALRDYQRLDLIGARAQERYPRSSYKVVVISASWCGPCQRFKREQLPALLKSGCEVEVLDYDKDKLPERVRSVPTILIYLQGRGTDGHTPNYRKIKTLTGYRTTDSILSLIDKHRGIK